MRNFVAATITAAIITTGALAATDSGAPLASGKPAGVRQAQDPDYTIWYVVAGGIVITGIVLVAINGNTTLTTGSTGTSTATTTTTH